MHPDERRDCGRASLGHSTPAPDYSGPTSGSTLFQRRQGLYQTPADPWGWDVLLDPAAAQVPACAGQRGSWWAIIRRWCRTVEPLSAILPCGLSRSAGDLVRAQVRGYTSAVAAVVGFALNYRLPVERFSSR